MNNDNAVVQSAGEGDTPQTNPPQVEQPTTEVETPVTKEVTEGTETQQTELERREFQNRRLAEENRKLKEEIGAKKQSESAFSIFRPKVTTPVGQPVGLDVNSYVDPNTGETNWAAYNYDRDNLIRNQVRAESQQAMDELLDEREARQQFPELFADQKVEKRIADRWLAAKIRGENVTVTQIASEENELFSKAIAKAEKTGAEKTLQELTPKEQASLTASAQTTSSARQASSDEELERLRQQSRGKGRESEDAIAQRLKGIPYNK